jgi:hypothetical protein
VRDRVALEEVAGCLRESNASHRRMLPGLSPVAWWAFDGFSMPSRRPRLRRLSHYCWSV